MEPASATELAPLPSSGYACGLTHDEALTQALLEACQARVTAISGSREDLTRQFYPALHNRPQLSDWRLQMQSTTMTTDSAGFEEPRFRSRWEGVVEALEKAGSKALVVVPLLASREIGAYSVRLIAPPLRQNPGA
jgi:ribosomal protein S12 methylthiotransferase accessory factor